MNRAALGELWRLVVRTSATRGRVAALGALAALGVVVGVAIGVGPDVDALDAGTSLVNAFGLSLFAPVTCLVLASAALGDLHEDATLVHIWLRPVPRWLVAVAAMLGVLTVALPLVVVPVVVASALAGAGADLVRGALLSTAVAVVAYSGLFLLLGLRVRRALVWGLAYLLIWEGFVATVGGNAARLAVRHYTRSLLSDATGVELRLADAGVAVAVGVPLLAALAAVWFTARRLERMDVT